MRFCFVFIIVFSFLFVQGQEKWSVTSDDGRVKVTNYICEDGAIDSVLFKTKSYHLNIQPLESDSFLNKVIRPSHSSYFFANRVYKVKEDMFVVLGKGGDVIHLFSMNIIFIDKGQVVKHLIIQSIDNSFTSFRFFYKEESKELIFRREIVNESDPAEVYDIDLERKQIMVLQPESENINEYLQELPSKITPDAYWYSGKLINFYKVRF